MLKIVHRINTVDELKKIPSEYGVEVDLRAEGNRIILNHEPFIGGEDFFEYLKVYKHAFIVLNIKEAGIEERVIEMVEARGIRDYFLLDVEFPYIFKATQQNVTQIFRPGGVLGDGIRSKDLSYKIPVVESAKAKIAVRYSESEPIEQALALKGLVEWVWIDTNTKLPLDKNIVQQLQGFKTCLVSPDRWGRPDDIIRYREEMRTLGFEPDAVMAGVEWLERWE